MGKQAQRQAQGTMVLPITVQQSLQAVKNSIRITLSSVCYLRSLFPENVFAPKTYCGVEMLIFSSEVKKFPDVNESAHNLIKTLEKGVFDALEKRYLERLLFNIHETDPTKEKNAPVLESYSFKFDYDSQHDEYGEVYGKTKEDVSTETKAMLKRLIMLTTALQKLPSQTYVSLNLIYNKSAPSYYEPPLFEQIKRSSLPDFSAPPLSIKVGELDSGHNTLVLKLRRPDSSNERKLLNPCLNEKPSKPLDNIAYDSSDAGNNSVDADETDTECYSEPANTQPLLESLALEREIAEEVPPTIPNTSTKNANRSLRTSEIELGALSKETENLYEEFKKMVKRNPKIPPKELIGNSQLGGIINDDLARKFLSRHRKESKQNVRKRKNKVAEKGILAEKELSNNAMPWSQDTVTGFQENQDPTQKASRSKRKIVCNEDEADKTFESVHHRKGKMMKRIQCTSGSLVF